MGTLFEQKPREFLHIDEKAIINEIETLKKIASKTKLSIDQVIKISEIKQLKRKNNLYVHNGDIHDEQMSGIGTLLEKIDSRFERLAIAFENTEP